MTDEPRPDADAAQALKAAHDDRREPHAVAINERLNWLRAGVLGANDGIVSTAAVVVGVAAATTSVPAILTAGAAAMIGGAISMALGEYVSVSSSKDTTQALIAKERWELANDPDGEFEELVRLYEAKGLSRATAERVTTELHEHDALAAHLETELHIAEDDIASPWRAAWASAVAFTLGAILPMLAILLPPAGWRIPVTFAAVLVALAITGAVAARIGGASAPRAVVRVIVGGALALGVTFAIGRLLGVSGIV
ncbi:MAG: VIT family protein [Actinomycetales bacterium]|nr:VIT family protein [Actinomycetales bacterium]